MYESLIFEVSREGRGTYQAPSPDVPAFRLEEAIPSHLLCQNPPELPQVSELDLMRHYTHLSRKNYGVDTHFYPLGSCTMKYNPKVNERVSRLQGFSSIHPYAGPSQVQGALELMWGLEKSLCQITGMSAFTLQPAAGAHGELTALLMIRAYFESQGEEGRGRTRILIPDSAHGTNPASAVLGGFQTTEIKSDQRGNVDLAHLGQNLDGSVACLMLTMPNTLGLFDENLEEIVRMVHANGSFLYMDGANLNALMGVARPSDLGFDVMHINLHKTFSTPHGGGGPGSGPVGVTERLRPFLPGPVVAFREGGYCLEKPEKSIGRVRSFYGNFLVMVKAYAYILSVGGEGIRQIARMAVLNANYLKEKLKGDYFLKYDRPCLHEFVLSACRQKEMGASAMDVSKRLLDYGYYAPTTYFPLIVEEALMVEPTETESKATLDEFAGVMAAINGEIRENPGLVTSAPHNAYVRRVDDVAAARKPVLRWTEAGS
jgi:glycine dehydrogenase subunit 2